MAKPLDQLAVNSIRAVAVDAVHKANSGHSGAPLGLAPVGHILWSRFLNFVPNWLNRDRFVLSGGHASALLYTLLHLHSGVVSLDDLKNFRQLNSPCGGHPHRHSIPGGVEATTGPLGQGLANAVGHAILREYLAARYNKPDFPLFSHKVYAFAGDGDLMEGISHEASALAGNQKLENLVVFWDDNKITICGPTDLTWSEDVSARYRAYGWEVIDVPKADTDFEAIAAAITRANAVKGKPVLIDLHSTIGFGSELAGSNKVHGVPLNAPQLAALKKTLGLNPDLSFNVPPEVQKIYTDARARVQKLATDWEALYGRYKTAFPAEAAEIEALKVGTFDLAKWKTFMPQKNEKDQATRVTSGQILNVIAKNIPGLIGGSADLTPSTNTALAGEKVFSPAARGSKYIEYGIRELAMQAIANGIQGYGLPGIVPYISTFFVFVQYVLPALRVAAFDGLRVINVLTHDSIGLGEDGPTHQNVENFAIVRALPRVLLFRPADTVETSASYTAAFTGPSRPAVFAFSRQTAPNIDGSSFDGTLRGGYIVKDVPNPAIVFIGTGTELSLAIAAAAKLGVPARIVSFPCTQLFDEQPIDYRKSVLPVGVPIVSVEAGIPYGWSKYSHKHFGVDDYGLSAPAPLVYDHFGLTPDKVAAGAKAVIDFYKAHPIPNLVEVP